MHDAHDIDRRTSITDALVDLIAEIADADRRSVIRRLAGLPLRGRVQRRIDAAIAVSLRDAQQAKRS